MYVDRLNRPLPTLAGLLVIPLKGGEKLGGNHIYLFHAHRIKPALDSPNADPNPEMKRNGTKRLSEAGENIAFMNNKGGIDGCAGEWSICGGNGQSFADATVGAGYAH